MSSSWRCSRCKRFTSSHLEKPVILYDSPLDANLPPLHPRTACVSCCQARKRRTGDCELCGDMAHRVPGVDGDACRVCGLIHAEEEPSRPHGLGSSPIAAFGDW